VEVIRIFLLEDGIKDPSHAIKTDLPLKVQDVENARIGKGVLYYAQKQTQQAPWKKTVAELTGFDIPGGHGKSDYVAIAIKVDSRWFMLTFGYGAFLLDPGRYETYFGTRVALNLMNKEKVKGVSTKGFGGNPLVTDRQLPLAGPLEEFRISFFDDWVRRIEARPLEGEFGDLLIGEDWLTIRRAKLPSDFRAFLRKILAAHKRERYKEIMPFLDRISTVRDQGLKDYLDNQLRQALQDRPDDVRISPPAVIDFANVEGFRFTSSEEFTRIELEPSLTTYKTLLSRENHLYATSRLRQDHLEAVGIDGRPVATWNLYSCLYLEVEFQNHAYFMTDGRWYEVKQGYKDELDKDLSRISCKLTLPASQQGQREDAYNKDAAKKLGWACMDQKEVYPEPGSPIEICDLYSPKGDFVHVKVYSGSQTLSHLFNQGVVSATLMVERPPVATMFGQKLAAEGHTNLVASVSPPIDATKHRVVYAILAKPGKAIPQDLPLFAKISLQGALRNLDRMSYPVCVVGVPRP
jgi:uncharacterized protein (TIGR04141 family)